MDFNTLIYILAIVFGFYMAWNVGANDVANAMGTSVGSKAISLKQAVLIAAIFEFSGAYLVGSHVTQTIRKGMVDISIFSSIPSHFVLGMLAALIATAIWLHLATYYGLPVSTTHSIVGAVIGFGLVAGGTSAVKWGGVGKIVLSWIVSPIAGGIFAYIIFMFVSKGILQKENPVEELKKKGPFLIGMLGFVLTMSVIYKGLKLKSVSLDTALEVAGLVFVAVAVISYLILKLVKVHTEYDYSQKLDRVEKIFAFMQVITACYVAFAHGSNDVANAVGPLSAIVNVLKEGAVKQNAVVYDWVLALGGAGIAIGVATYGYKVIETVGKKITDISPSRGFSAEFSAATTILICSKLGLPISTTHTLVGAVIGVGFARGIAGLNVKVIRDIVYSWLITLPFTGFLAAILYYVFINIASL